MGLGLTDNFMVTVIIVLQHLNECVLHISMRQINSFYRTGHEVLCYGISLFLSFSLGNKSYNQCLE